MRTLPFLCLLFLLTACQQSSSSSQKILRLNLRTDPASFDPRQVRTLRDLTLMKQLYEGLMRIDSNGIAQPAIAQGVIASEDALHYTFFLRETEWNNQQPLTAGDFVRSWEKVADPDFPCDYAYMLACLESVKAPDPHTLEVTLNKPIPYFLELTAFPTYFPVHAEKHVTNGPFQLEKWRPSSELILSKNPSYWDADSVQLDGITFLMIDDNNTESHLFYKKKLDWLGQPISHNLTTEMLANATDPQSYPVAGTYWLRCNLAQAPLGNRKVRQALCLAIDRQALITHILHGDQAVATGPVPPSMKLSEAPYFQDNQTTQAQHLLQEALEEEGWSQLPPITLSFPPTERTLKLVQLLQQQWKEVLGVNIKLRALEEKVFREHIRSGEYAIGTGEWIADYHDPLAFLEIFRDANPINATGWEDPHFTELLDRSLTSATERLELLRQAEALLMEEMPIIPLYHYAYDYLKRSNVAGVVLSPLGTADFKFARLQ